MRKYKVEIYNPYNNFRAFWAGGSKDKDLAEEKLCCVIDTIEAKKLPFHPVWTESGDKVFIHINELEKCIIRLREDLY